MNEKASDECLPGFHPDDIGQSAVALHLHLAENDGEIPVHQHRKGQLVMALHGAVTCQVADAMWIVPPQCGVWIPSNIPHRNFATANAKLCYLFVEPGLGDLPDECCTLAISPMVREMILRLAEEVPGHDPGGHIDRLVMVLLCELARMPKEMLNLLISHHPKIQKMAESFRLNPGDRSTLKEWSKKLAISERSLSRLMLEETGMTFGRWRQRYHILVAVRELAEGSPVQRVADNLGYESVTAFITMFKKALGLPPARYLATLTRSPWVLPR